MGILSKWKPMGRNKDGNTFMERTGPDGKEQFLEIDSSGKEILTADNKQTVVYNPPAAPATPQPHHYATPAAHTTPANHIPVNSPAPQPAAPQGVTPAAYHPAHNPPATTASVQTPSSAAQASSPQIPAWAKGIPGWKPGDKEVTEASTTPGQSGAGYMTPTGNVVFKNDKGAILEATGGGNVYTVQKAPSATAPHHISPDNGISGMITDNSDPSGRQNQPIPSGGTNYTVGNQVSENGQGQSGAAAPAPTWNTNMAPNLGGIGGSALADHGTALADKLSADNQKIITQMSDGTYESVDLKTGAVDGAGTWGDGAGGGVAKNGIGAPSSIAGTDSSTVTNNGSTSNDANTAATAAAVAAAPPVPGGQALAPPVVSNTTTTPLAPPVVPVTTSPTQNTPAPSATDIYTDTSTSRAPAYSGGADPVKVQHLKNGATLTTTASGAEIEQMPGHSAYEVKAPTSGVAYVDPVPKRPSVDTTSSLTNFGVDTNAHGAGRASLGRFLE